MLNVTMGEKELTITKSLRYMKLTLGKLTK